MPDVIPTILIADDELSIRRSLSVILRKKYNVVTAATGEEALSRVRKEDIDLVLLDLKLPDMDGLEVLRQVKRMDANVMAVVITAVKETKTAVDAMKIGAYDFITKPFDVGELRALVDNALEKRALIKENIFLKAEMAKGSFGELVGQSAKIQEVFELIDKAAKSDCTVLVSGESGTGKELITRAIHSRSARAVKPFMVVNCAAIPDNLLESELFGYERGSFTGALEKREGKFELANGGIIFLDEIGSMSMHLQAKILRVLQDRKDGLKEVERLGSSKVMTVDVRIISATNVDLKRAIKEKKFREDLFYRLNVLPIYIAPLRDRKEDVPLLIDYFVKKFSKKSNKIIKRVSREALNSLVEYCWPGNVRELENLIERLVTLNVSGEIDVEELPLEVLVNREPLSDGNPGRDINLDEAVMQVERQFIKKALRTTRGNQARAAKILGIHRNTLFNKLSLLGIREEV
jgi:two-component system response regulator AtoC